MKEIIIILSILIIVFVGAYFTQKYLNHTADLLVSKLEDLKAKLEEGKTGEKEMQEKTDEIYSEWEEINEEWSVIILHDEIDLIETSLIKMKAEIKSGEIEDAMAEIETSIFLLNHIKEKEKTSLKNIF